MRKWSVVFFCPASLPIQFSKALQVLFCLYHLLIFYLFSRLPLFSPSLFPPHFLSRRRNRLRSSKSGYMNPASGKVQIHRFEIPSWRGFYSLLYQMTNKQLRHSFQISDVNCHTRFYLNL